MSPFSQRQPRIRWQFSSATAGCALACAAVVAVVHDAAVVAVVQGTRVGAIKNFIPRLRAPAGTPKYGKKVVKKILKEIDGSPVPLAQQRRNEWYKNDIYEAEKILARPDSRDIPRLQSGLQPPKALPPPRSIAAGIAKTSPRLLSAGGPQQKPTAALCDGGHEGGALAVADVTSRGAVALLCAHTRTPLSDKQLKEAALAVTIGAERGSLRAEDLSDAIWAITVAGPQASQELKGSLVLLADTLMGRASELDGESACDALWSTAVMQDEAPLLKMLLPSLVERMVRTAPTMSPRAAAMAMWSVANLHSDFTHHMKLNMDPVIELLAGRFHSQAHNADAAAVAHMLWSIAIMSVPKAQMRALAPLLAEAVRRVADDLKGEILQVVLWSVTTLSGTIAGKELRTLVPLLTRAVQKELPGMSPKQIANCMWSLGSMDQGRGQAADLLGDSLEELAVAADELPPSDLSLFMWSLVALDIRNQDLVQVCAARAIEILKFGSNKHAGQNVPRITWAIGRLGLHDRTLRYDFLKAIQNRFALDKIENEKAIRHIDHHASLTSFLWGMGQLDHDDQFEKFRDDVAAKLKNGVKKTRKYEYIQTSERFHKHDIRAQIAVNKGGDSGPDEPVPRKTLSDLLGASKAWYLKGGEVSAHKIKEGFGAVEEEHNEAAKTNFKKSKVVHTGPHSTTYVAKFR